MTAPRLGRALGISAALHAALISPWWLGHSAAAPVRAPALVVELQGLTTGRQVQARPAEPMPPPLPARAAAPAPPTHRSTARADPPVDAAGPVPALAAAAEPADPAPSVAAPAGPTAPAEAATPAQALRHSDAERAALRVYLAALQRALQQRLRYPAESRQAAEVGAPWVRFSLSAAGELVPGTLAVARSSGFARLDEQALAAVRASLPLAPPPRAMDVVISVTFERAEPGPP